MLASTTIDSKIARGIRTCIYIPHNVSVNIINLFEDIYPSYTLFSFQQAHNVTTTFSLYRLQSSPQHLSEPHHLQSSFTSFTRGTRFDTFIYLKAF